jgi:hypothetical protein
MSQPKTVPKPNSKYMSSSKRKRTSHGHNNQSILEKYYLAGKLCFQISAKKHQETEAKSFKRQILSGIPILSDNVQKKKNPLVSYYQA